MGIHEKNSPKKSDENDNNPNKPNNPHKPTLHNLITLK